MADARRIWLAVPAIALFATDVALTLRGQSAEYWSGQFDLVVEGNPVAKPILASSPWLFLGLSVAWALLLLSAISLWKHRVANGLARLVAFGHAIGAASWMLNGPLGWAGVIVFLIIASELSARCWRRAEANSNVE